MSLVLFNVHVPMVYQRKRQDCDVKGKGDNDKVKEMMGADEDRSLVDMNPMPATYESGVAVRKFIEENRGDLRYAAELPYKNGTKTWLMFAFTCKSDKAEGFMNALAELHVGGSTSPDVSGIGMVNIIPLQMQRIASVPLTIGNPQLMAHGSPTACAASQNSLFQCTSDGNEERPGLNVTFNGDGSVTSDLSFHVHPDEFEEENVAFQQIEEEIAEGEKPTTTVEKYTGKFMSTVKSRVAIESVIELIQSSAEFSFDFCMLVIVAGTLACIGLVTNNVVVIVASMLVSPLMGPILGVTFGLVMHDKELIKLGLFSELVGLFLCVVVGFIGGLCSAPLVGDTWPTQEMYSRMVPRGLITGACIAIPSGIGVALSVLGNNTSSLVGVAISASLLPPAVNTGILLACAALSGTDVIDSNYTIANDWISANPSDHYTEVDTQKMLYGSLFSFLLTVLNIICIWVSGFFMFKVKEVAPVGKKSEFWRTTVPEARQYNDTVAKGSKDAETLAEAVKRYAGSIPRETANTFQVFNAKRPKTGMSKLLGLNTSFTTVDNDPASTSVGKRGQDN